MSDSIPEVRVRPKDRLRFRVTQELVEVGRVVLLRNRPRQEFSLSETN